MENIINNYIKDNNIEIDATSNGLDIRKEEDSIIIKGSQYDLIELADYILSLALSDNNKDHIHLDDLTMINDNSSIKEIIIEKD